MKNINLKELFIGAGIGATTAVLLFAVASVASAAFTFSATSMSGDGAVNIDGASTISIGNSTATGITIGQSAHTVTFPGTITATQVGVGSQNLTVSDGDILFSAPIQLGSGGVTLSSDGSGNLVSSGALVVSSIVGTGITPSNDTGGINIPFSPADAHGSTMSIYDARGNQPDIKFFDGDTTHNAEIAWLHSGGMIFASSDPIMILSSTGTTEWTFNVGAGGGSQDDSLDGGGNAIKNLSSVTINKGSASTGSGVCYTSSGTFGHCTATPNGSGVCTCAAN